jgi:hypothetical protein
MRRHAGLSSRAPGGTPKPPADAKLVSSRSIRLTEPRRAGIALVLLLAGSCIALPSEPEPRVLQTQVGPIGAEVRGFIGGLTNVDVTRLVQAGVVEACPGRVSSYLGEVGRPPLSMIWHLDDGGGRSTTATIAARLLACAAALQGDRPCLAPQIHHLRRSESRSPVVAMEPMNEEELKPQC